MTTLKKVVSPSLHALSASAKVHSHSQSSAAAAAVVPWSNLLRNVPSHAILALMVVAAVVLWITCSKLFKKRKQGKWITCSKLFKKRKQGKNDILLAGFQDSVAHVAARLRSTGDDDDDCDEDDTESESNDRVRLLLSKLFIENTKQRLYFAVNLKENQIRDSHTEQILVEGIMKAQFSFLTLEVDVDKFDNSNATLGLSLKGQRTVCQNEYCIIYDITEGYLSSDGKAYWVEHGTDRAFLTMGRFAITTDKELGHDTLMSSLSSPLTFEGEWLTSKGERGRYSLFKNVPESEIRAAAPKEVLTNAIDDQVVI